jgi:hypothetical protein
VGKLLDELEDVYGELPLACYDCGRETRRTVVSFDEKRETVVCETCPLPYEPGRENR